MCLILETWRYVDSGYLDGSQNNALLWVIRLLKLSCGWHHMAQVIPWALLWRHNEGECVSNHQPHDCLLSHLFGRWSKKTPKLRVAGLCAGNSPETDEFPAQMASNAENVSIWWRHHGTITSVLLSHLHHSHVYEPSMSKTAASASEG